MGKKIAIFVLVVTSSFLCLIVLFQILIQYLAKNSFSPEVDAAIINAASAIPVSFLTLL